MSKRDEALTTSEMIYQELKKDIIRGVYPSGKKIKLEDIKERYKVSYSPLREALSRLAESQLLENSGQRGFRVPQMSQSDFEDITNSRIRLECMVLALAIENGDLAWESQIVAAYHLLSQQEKLVHDRGNVSLESLDALDKAHEAFHQALLAGSQSNWMLFFVRSLNSQFDRYRRYSVTFQYSANRSVEYHQRLRDLVIARNKDEAVKVLADHIQHSAKAILGNF